jgi:hypothetical protein
MMIMMMNRITSSSGENPLGKKMKFANFLHALKNFKFPLTVKNHMENSFLFSFLIYEQASIIIIIMKKKAEKFLSRSTGKEISFNF